MTDFNSTPDTDKVSFWQQHLAQWQSSNLTQQNYCREQGLSYRQFLYWRGRQKLLQQEQSIPVCSVPVSVVSEVATVEKSVTNRQIELFVGSAKVRLPLEVCPQYVAQLVSALQ